MRSALALSLSPRIPFRLGGGKTGARSLGAGIGVRCALPPAPGGDSTLPLYIFLFAALFFAPFFALDFLVAVLAPELFFAEDFFAVLADDFFVAFLVAID
jgi:hypothetical protein